MACQQRLSWLANMAGLNATDGLIFRITHRDNVPWVLEHGLHCQSSSMKDPHFVGIGMADLIRRRCIREVPIGPKGTLSDYVPFYFTPYSIMLYNIKTGHNGVIQRPNEQIVILVSSIPRLVKLGLSFVFTNAHAYTHEADYFESPNDLDKVDWPLLQSRNFQRDPENPGKIGRYQAEALVHRHVPVEALLGIACYNSTEANRIAAHITEHRVKCSVKTLPHWYF